jgi:hypothetical protein
MPLPDKKPDLALLFSQQETTRGMKEMSCNDKTSGDTVQEHTEEEEQHS